MLSLIKFNTVELALDDIFNDIFNLGRIEALMLTRLHSVGWQMGHTWSTKVYHLVLILF